MMSGSPYDGTAMTPEEPHYISREELLDELAFQKLMMQSLDPTSEDYEETKGEIEKSIASLRTKLAALKQKKKPAVNVVLKRPFLAAKSSSNKPSFSPDTSSPYQPLGLQTGIPSLNNLQTYNSLNPISDSLPTETTPSNMNPSSDSRSAQAQANISSTSQTTFLHRNGSGNMKRSIDESTGLDMKEESEHKSRRTSPGSSVPTPPTYKVDSNGFMDLCGSDEEDVRAQQKRALERVKQVQKDREVAEITQKRYNSFSESRVNPTPSSGNNAFDRIMGGSSQAQNGDNGTKSSLSVPKPVQYIDSDDDEPQFMSSKAVGAPVPGSYALGPTWQNTGVAASQRLSNFTPYTPSYTTQAVMPYQSTQKLDGSHSLAQANGMGFSGSTWADPMEIAERNLSSGQQADLETYCLDPRRTQDEISKLLANIKPDMEIPKENREGTPSGLRFALYEHQKVALTWLKGAESGSNKGGILADDMGLGKTISTIALMLSSPSPYRGCRTTLIVAPVALLRQWEKEIASKILPAQKLSVFMFSSSKRKSYAELRNYDVVLTSYGILASEYKQLEDLQKRKLAHPEMNLLSDQYQKKFPFLGHKSKWYRVVLDEAQNVKNKNTKSARAVTALTAEIRFCLTGTPMQNGVFDLYSLIRFLRIRPYNESTEFEAAFGVLKRGTGRESALKRAMTRLQALLRSILLRRTKKSTIDGKPLIDLPPKTEEPVYAIFDEGQQAYYTALESQSKITFNKFLKAGTVGKNYSNVLVLLLRLRQAACHPHLIMDVEQASLPNGGGDMLALARTLPADVVRRLMASEVPFDCPVCYDPLLNPIFTLDCCHHVCSECLVKITSGLGAEDGAKAKCPSCRSEIDINRCIDWTSYKEAHMGEKSAEAAEVDDYSDSDSNSDFNSGTFSEAGNVDDEADVDAHGNLKDFIVPVNVTDDGFVSHKAASKKKRSVSERRPSRNTDSDNDTEDDDLDAKPKPESKTEDVEDSEDEEPAKPEADPDDDYLPEYPPFTKLKADPALDDYLPETPPDARARGMFPEKLERITKKVALEADAKAARKQAHKARRQAESKSRKNKGPKEDYKTPHKHLNLATLKKEASRNAEGKKKYMRYLRANFVTSAKIDKLMKILLNTPKGVKTIVFSQFTTLLDLCEVPITKEGIEVGRFDGSMRADKRHEAVEAFQLDPRSQVLLVSLKAGNAGLNLNSGSQVVILDPFWNPYVEMQAVDRAHRIGQQNQVKVSRILVKGTVEDRIVALQERKRKLVDSALDEKSGNAVSKLGIEELKYLFSSDEDVRETLVRAPQIPGQPDFSGMGAGGRIGGGYGAGPGLGSVMGAGLNAGLGALNAGAALGSALGSAAKAVVNPYLAAAGMGGSNVYGGGMGANGSGMGEPSNRWRDAANLMNGGSSSEAASSDPEFTPEYLAFGNNAARYGGYGGYGGRY